MKALSEEEFKAALPPQMSKTVNPLLIMRINNVLDNSEEWEHYRNNLLDYTYILRDGKFTVEQYINAVRFVGFKVMGHTGDGAYRRTFPEKYEKWLADGVSSKTIASYVTSFNKSKLVNLLYEQTLVPSYILNAHMFQDALNTQSMIMNNEDASFKVRSDAANSIMTHLKPPEATKIEMDIGIKQDSVVEQYQEAMTIMVEQQMKLLEAGADVKEIANAAIPNAEIVEE
jgi:hypothetical protein